LDEIINVDFDGNIYLLYSSVPPPGTFGADLDAYVFKHKVLVFNQNLILVETLVNTGLEYLDEKTKSYFIFKDDAKGNRKYYLMKYSP
jgi:hypothetical protein